ncbi:hypothetical protein EJ04DRAFT_541275 [Polyplosphaeria fusca]|uniref:Uncharacterized protein n=1 Tax=Polyplosphaeria fusca TaxID=682080 RepID=A0A9P4R7P4_9PLEO|nr:hypothetical protein EJ04DRAFT_541275 [Polyplosphaeria fusca]
MKLLKKYGKSLGRKPRPAGQASDNTQDQLLHANDAVTRSTPSLRPARSLRSAQPASRSLSRKKGYGLELLYDGTLHNRGEDGFGIDIVAIHGLNGNAYSTWRHSNGLFWLKDLLPNDLPAARIFTYAYPAEVLFSKSVGDILDYSRNLLNDIWDKMFETLQAKVTLPRPIIFVCHSLGGLVCKQALLLANEPRNQFKDVLSATAAIVFLGTPHRGSKIAEAGKLVGSVANAVLRITQIANVTGSIRSDLISALRADSGNLQSLTESFHDQLDYLKIATFYERQPTPPLQKLVVDRESAILGIPGEQVIPLNADHRSMCRFDSRNKEYLTVLNEVRRLARDAKANRYSAQLSLMSSEKRCMSLLYSASLADYKTQLPRPVQGTCNWILKDPLYTSWMKSEETGLLWVTGEPGCGKTMLSLYLTEHLEFDPVRPTHSQVFYFFCDDKITTQRDAKDIMRSILHQILQQHRKLIKFARSRWETTGQNLVESFTALWEIFLNIISEARVGTIGVIMFLRFVQKLVNDSRTLVPRPRNCVKFLITSRPSTKELAMFSSLNSTLQIDDDSTRVSDDIKLVIQSRFGHIASKAGFSDDTRAELEDLLHLKAERSFLWLNLVLRRLEDTPSTSRKDFERIIHDFIRRISHENRNDGREILCLLIGSSRHLTLKEMDTAYTIRRDIYKSLTNVEEDQQHAMGQMLQDVVGAFIRIEASKISLIHQSVKNFLSEFAPRSSDEIVPLAMATSCIRYLLLDDFAKNIFIMAHPGSETDYTEIELEADPYLLNYHASLAMGVFLNVSADVGDEECSRIAQTYGFFDYAAMHWANHFAACESMVTKGLLKDVRRLLEEESSCSKNWLLYFWANNDMGCALPDDFSGIMIAAFFDFSLLLEDYLHELAGPTSQFKMDRALFWAARAGSVRSTRVLLRCGANPNAQALDRHTPLTIASHLGHLEVVKVLLSDAQCDVAIKGRNGRSALSFAAGNSHLEVFQQIAEQSNSQLQEVDENAWTPLFWAIERDHTIIARALLHDPAVDINHLDRNGRTVLSWAAGEGFLQALRLLLAHPKVDVNLADHEGRSPLLWAANNGREEVIEFLMQGDYGVNRMSKDKHHRSALSLACAKGQTDTVKALLKYRCGEADEEDINGWTPLAWALDRRSPQTVETILSGREIQLNRKDYSGRTVLMWATSYGYAEIVRLLLDQGADPCIEDNHGCTALDFAKSLETFDRGDVVHLLEAALTPNNPTGPSV